MRRPPPTTQPAQILEPTVSFGAVPGTTGRTSRRSAERVRLTPDIRDHYLAGFRVARTP